jgi:hypothetical protein
VANANVSDIMRTYQHIHDLSELYIILYNDTRWEGRFSCMQRFHAVRESIVCLEHLELVAELRGKVGDFLQTSFFARLAQYLVYLRAMNDISLLLQTQSFPTGCVVPLCVLYQQKLFEPSENDIVPKFLADFKCSFAKAVDAALMRPILGTATAFSRQHCFTQESDPICQHLCKRASSMTAGLLSNVTWRQFRRRTKTMQNCH